VLAVSSNIPTPNRFHPQSCISKFQNKNLHVGTQALCLDKLASREVNGENGYFNQVLLNREIESFKFFRDTVDFFFP